MCLPTCPTYDITKLERHSPRGRISLMRAIADDKISVSKEFAEEMSYCLGCLACKTACPAGVDYPQLFEMSRAEIERSGINDKPTRSFIRWASMKVMFGNQHLLHLFGRMLYLYRVTGLQGLVRKSKVLKLFPERLEKMERMTPDVQKEFSHQLIREGEGSEKASYRVGILTGCVQDMIYADINRDTVDVLIDAGCHVLTPRGQLCCGSLHAHNGEHELSKDFARKLIDQFDLDYLDAVITNAGGCGSHLKHYDKLLEDDPAYAKKAKLWSTKLKDIHAWLTEIDYQPKAKNNASGNIKPLRITYHDSCHLAHGQGIVQEPRALLKSLSNIELVELPEANWCCGSAGVYNITQPETAAELAHRKLDNIRKTGCSVVVTANPGCLLHLQKFAEQEGLSLELKHPVSILAEATR